MNETQFTTAGATDGRPTDLAMDVFAAARWFDSLWNSRAKAVSVTEIEWQCNTWGSGRGSGDWLDTAVFLAVATAFGFRSWTNDEERDELVIAVPLDQFREVARVVDRLGEEPESWPWFAEDCVDDRQRQIAIAAEVLGMPPAALGSNTELLAVLRIE